MKLNPLPESGYGIGEISVIVIQKTKPGILRLIGSKIPGGIRSGIRGRQDVMRTGEVRDLHVWQMTVADQEHFV